MLVQLFRFPLNFEIFYNKFEPGLQEDIIILTF